MQFNTSRRLLFSRVAICIGIWFLLCLSAYGDGISLDYFMRFRTYRESATYIWSMVFVLMLANYALNFLVIGWPAIRVSPATPRRIAIGLIVLTVLGQVADRLGAFVTLIVLAPLGRAYEDYIVRHIRGESPGAFGTWLSQHMWLGEHASLILNFFFSGAAVALLTWVFLRRWSVSRSIAWKITLAAAVFTNPAWAIGLLSFNA